MVDRSNVGFAAMAAVCTLGAGTALGQAQTFQVGDRVELEASGRWVPCVVTEPGPEIVRARCEEYPALSRAAGVYIAQNAPSSIRRAGATAAAQAKGPAPKAAPAKAPAGQGGALRVGEYACYGSGGRIMIGLGFKVTAPGRFTDLDGKNPGTYVITGSTINFRGGHLDGQQGRELNGANFRIGAQASCEPF